MAFHSLLKVEAESVPNDEHADGLPVLRLVAADANSSLGSWFAGHRKTSISGFLLLASVVYRAAQELGIFANDVTIFPLLVLALVVWALALGITSAPVRRLWLRSWRSDDYRQPGVVVALMAFATITVLLYFGFQQLSLMHSFQMARVRKNLMSFFQT